MSSAPYLQLRQVEAWLGPRPVFTHLSFDLPG